jgi:hypothetical protein
LRLLVSFEFGEPALVDFRNASQGANILAILLGDSRQTPIVSSQTPNVLCQILNVTGQEF